MNDKCPARQGSKARTQPARKRTVSAARSSQPTRPVNFRMTPKEIAQLDECAMAAHRSRSELILLGLRRCMRDGIWHAVRAPAPASRDSVSPPAELVRLSQVLLGLAMSLDSIFSGARRSSRRMQDAAANLADAKIMLARLAEDLGCS